MCMCERMRIYYLSATPLPSLAANTVHVMRMCSAFARAGHDVTLVTAPPRDPALRDVDPYEFYHVAKRFRIVFQERRRVRGSACLWGLEAAWKARRARADLAYGRAVLGCYYAARLGTPTVFEAHEPLTQERPRKLKRARRLLSHPNLRRLVVLSRALGERFRNELGVPEARMRVAYNAADEPPDGVAPYPLPNADAGLRVGYAGGLYPGKGIELIAAVAPHCGSAQFYVAGGSADELASWREAAEDIPNLHLLGRLRQEELPGFRAAVDVILVPPKRRVSVSSGGEIDQALAPPLKLFEALAAGKAVVCSDYLDEVVTHGEHALLCDPEQPEQWVAALRALAEDAELRRRLAEGARRLFAEGLSWDARAAKVLEGLQ